MVSTTGQSSTAGYSVVIPSCGRPEMLQRALDSIASQTVSPKKIYLVIDEAEGDKEYSFLVKYGDALQTKFTGGGLGGAGARNLGLDQLSDEDYVFFLDDDDEWCSSKIEKQLSYLENNKNIIGITCWNYNIDGRSTEINRKTPL